MKWPRGQKGAPVGHTWSSYHVLETARHVSRMFTSGGRPSPRAPAPHARPSTLVWRRPNARTSAADVRDEVRCHFKPWLPLHLIGWLTYDLSREIHVRRDGREHIQELSQETRLTNTLTTPMSNYANKKMPASRSGSANNSIRDDSLTASRGRTAHTTVLRWSLEGQEARRAARVKPITCHE